MQDRSSPTNTARRVEAATGFMGQSPAAHDFEKESLRSIRAVASADSDDLTRSNSTEDPRGAG